jgi:asparagine N-glycosylation enzyme membrane subunit Stt3
MILPFSLGDNYIGGYFTHIGLSFLYICLLGLSSSILVLKYYITDKKILFLATGILVVSFIFALLPQLKTALNFVTKNEWTKTITELQPLFLKAGYIETVAINNIYGRFYYLWPIAALLIAIDSTVKKRFYFIYFVLVIGFLNFVVIKYSAWFSPYYALLLAYFIYVLYTILDRLKGVLKSLKFIVVGGVLFVIFQPVFAAISFQSGTLPSPDVYASYEWLRDSTEATSYFFEPTKKPEYGVMSFWHNGHYIIYISQRPAVVTNFGADTPHFDISNIFVLSQTEEEANQILRDYNVRYIYCDYSPAYILYSAKYLNRDIREYFDVYHMQMQRGVPGSAMFIKEKGVKTFYYRLSKFNGCGVYFQDTTFIEPIRHSRMIYASPSQMIKIYEFVEGAILKGKTNPRTPVIAEVDVNLQHISFTWSDSLLSNTQGVFVVTCPYSTDTIPARIIVDRDTLPMNIADEAVMNGDTLVLPLFQHTRRVSRF